MNDTDFEKQSKILAEELESFFGDIFDEDEWDTEFQAAATTFSQIKTRGRRTRSAWQAVLNSGDHELARRLVRDWANQGDFSPDEAYRMLQKWYDHLKPVWESLDSEEPAREIFLPPYDPG